jgi:GxxExxY protein
MWNRSCEELTFKIIGCAMNVHTALGPGLLESAYGTCLHHDLQEAKLSVRREVPLPICYKGVVLEVGYRLDRVVEDLVVIELKCVDVLAPIHKAQLISYRKLGEYPAGLLINFNTEHLSDGVHRLYPPNSKRRNV